MSYARRHSTNVCPGNRVRYTSKVLWGGADRTAATTRRRGRGWRCLEGRCSIQLSYGRSLVAGRSLSVSYRESELNYSQPVDAVRKPERIGQVERGLLYQ